MLNLLLFSELAVQFCSHLLTSMRCWLCSADNIVWGISRRIKLYVAEVEEKCVPYYEIYIQKKSLVGFVMVS